MTALDKTDFLSEKTRQFLAERHHPMLIGGRWVDAALGQKLEVLNPPTKR